MFSFLHRAKRSEPPRAQPPILRSAPAPPQDRSKRESFRGQPISSPRLESSTKRAQSLENMTDVGYRIRALPARPDDLQPNNVVFANRPNDAPPGGAISPPPAGVSISPPPVPNGIPSYRTPHLPHYPPAQPTQAAPSYSVPRSYSTSHSYPGVRQPAETTQAHTRPDRPPPTYMDKVTHKQNTIQEEVPSSTPPMPPPPLLKARIVDSTVDRASPGMPVPNQVHSNMHKYENMLQQTRTAGRVGNAGKAINHHNNPSTIKPSTDRSHSTSQESEDTKPSNHRNEFKSSFDKGSTSDTHSKPVARSNSASNRNPSASRNRMPDSAGRGTRPPGRPNGLPGKKPAVNWAGKPAISKKPEGLSSQTSDKPSEMKTVKEKIRLMNDNSDC